uniref:NADP-dependent oxidoreductase domain-containing protein n=1 Tax=Coccolithus braarudii TaxID=221442 RepID=A0A7S0L8G3_9EUKA
MVRRGAVVLLLTILHLYAAQGTATARSSAIVMATARPKKGKGKSKPPKAAQGGFGGFSAQPKTVTIPSLQLSSGVSIPALGFGTYRTGGVELRAALDHAIAVGYRHIDTARVYQNEAVVGAAIAASGIPREEFFITTKLWGTDHGDENARRAIQLSLSELGMEYVDSVLIHGPDNLGSSAEEKILLRQQTWQVMEEQLEAGSVRTIGVSNFEARHVESILACGSIKPTINQVEMHAYLAQSELRAYCAKEDILLTAYGSVGAEGLRTDPMVQDIAKVHKRTPAQISLRHTLQRGAIVLAKSTTPKRITKNAQIFDFELSPDEVAALDVLDAAARSYWDNSDVP